MKYEELIDFIANKMRMSHVYQPLLIKELVESGGVATIRQLAAAFLSHDEGQIQYYEKRIKEMPVRVLKSHDVISASGQLIELNTGKLTFEQKANIKMICEQKIQDFLIKRGLNVFRLSDQDPVPDSLRYRVLRDSGGRCALCGATKNETILDVDHIKPRSKGGTNDIENLQVLCAKCNRSKGNKDDTDFRHDPIDKVDDCIFCYHNLYDRIQDEYDSMVLINDGFPVSPGHSLIIPKRHVPDFFMLTDKEKKDSDRLLKVTRNRIVKDDNTVKGFNVGVNCGGTAGQTVFHVHIHLIPRREGDTPNPRGGVRGVIPAMMSY